MERNGIIQEELEFSFCRK